ncbi:MAG: RNA polymerase sigma factor FliA [Gammaproteobacteria bacterium]|nr:RNA polymerase sigma factor FliA [Gammaproteobacteria bacterium]
MSVITAYVANGASINERVEYHAPLVKRIAHHLMGRLPQSVQVDDLIQAGMIGLLEALKHYDDAHGASFETYAGIRIRGAMLDEVRRNDWAPRSVHRKARRVAEAVRVVEGREGREASAREIAAELEIPLDEYYDLLADANGHRFFSLDETGGGDDSFVEHIPDEHAGVVDGIESEEFHKHLASAIEGLPERERLVMALYYDQEFNLKEIGVVLGVTESRVCQIHSQALLRLRARLGS